jgi:type I restriction enzyme, S subunit
MSRWRTVPFGDLYAIPSKNGLMAPRRVRGAGVSLINMKELFAYERIGDVPMELAPLPEKRPEEWLVQDGDLLFARQSLKLEGAGKCVLVEPSLRPRTFESHIIRVRLRNDVAHSPFFYYYFKSAAGRDTMRTIVEQVAAAGIRASDLSRLDVPLPSVHEQCGIAATLNALEGKIESNRRTIDILLALVTAEFSRRFGRKALALPVGEIADVVDCLHSKKPDRAPVGPTLMQLNNIRDDGLVELSERFSISESDYAIWSRRFETRPWDCVITNVGRIGAVARIPGDFVAALGRNMTGIRPRSPNTEGAFLAAALLSTPVRREIELRTDAGTIMNALNVRSIPHLRLPDADAVERRRFHSWSAPFLERADTALIEIRALETTRDELLPLLLSGRIRVPEATEAVEEAVG